MLDEAKKQKLKRLIENDSNIFALLDAELEKTILVNYKIETGNAEPIKQRAIPYTLREQVA